MGFMNVIAAHMDITLTWILLDIAKLLPVKRNVLDLSNGAEIAEDKDNLWTCS